MATVLEHLSVEELEERYVGCQDATAARHFQVIRLLARGHTAAQVSETTAYGERWVEQLLARYNAEGARGSRRFAPPQWRAGNDLEARAPGEAGRPPSRTAV
jgi:Winged helix-turn helix